MKLRHDMLTHGVNIVSAESVSENYEPLIYRSDDY